MNPKELTIINEQRQRLRNEGKHILDAIPERTLCEWNVKLYTLAAFAWDYTDTLCDLCIQMRIKETKPLVRRIRELKLEYDRFRKKTLPDAYFKQEEENFLLFEEGCGDYLNKLFYGIELEVNKLNLTKESRLLVVATQQAMTILDAVKLFAEYCDRKIKETGVWVAPQCMLQREVISLQTLVPAFAGDCYQSDLPARKLTAQAIVNKIMGVTTNPIKE